FRYVVNNRIRVVGRSLAILRLFRGLRVGAGIFRDLRWPSEHFRTGSGLAPRTEPSLRCGRPAAWLPGAVRFRASGGKDMADVGRRAFVTLITLIGGGAVSAAMLLWPLPALAQQPGAPVVGYLYPGGSQGSGADQVAAFRKGLGEAGYIEGQNVAIEYRWA